MRYLITAAAAVSACALSAPALAQTQPQAVVSLYRAAPGQQVALLKWMANQERASVAAGVAPSVIYVHTSGDWWDFVVINPVTTPAQDAAVEAAGKRLGIDAGPRASIDFRKYISTHTDTTTLGPMSVSQYLAMIGEK